MLTKLKKRNHLKRDGQSFDIAFTRQVRFRSAKWRMADKAQADASMRDDTHPRPALISTSYERQKMSEESKQLNTVIQNAVLRVAGGFAGQQIQVEHNDKSYVVSFERTSTWDNRANKSVSHPYVTTWVHVGWPGYNEARLMLRRGEWQQIISKALNIEPSMVQYGFGHDQFDVRPF